MDYRSIAVQDAGFLTRIFSVPEYDLYFAENDTTEEGWRERIPLYEGARSLIVSDGRNDVGWLMYSLEGSVCFVRIIALLPGERHKGYGSAIVRDLLARNPRVGAIKLDVQQRNRPAVAFYRKLGFKVVSEETQLVKGAPVPYYNMRLERPSPVRQ